MIKTRPGTSDERTVKEIKAYRCVPVPKNCRVLDIGGHIGCFTYWALEQGAGKVVTYEPEPDNFRMLKINTKNKPVTIHNKAVTSNGRTVTLNVKTSGHTGGHSIVYSGPTRDHVEVPSVSFKQAVSEFKPHLVKIDCEGAEYEFDLPNSLPKSVLYVVMELHLQRKDMREQGIALVDRMKSWEVLKEPKISPKGWACVGAWRRP